MIPNLSTIATNSGAHLLPLIQHWRRHGIKPQDSMRQRLKVRHPSDVAIEDKIKSLNAGIALIREDPNYVKFREYLHHARCE
ncbi:hypothetical protein N7517_010289 [Penicillium concentricum]|uniref:Uncharacterized protein n=1 Tax=Penicillium concentricum TaxID=293559 RepID=A0A9W9R9W6_9EURO|nr:uncharacterized protein N7517_010289 [Penicillium concentricum]KAJ5355680.1 hypothetical protein N7517_010289 [Penicillium concentricum]